MITGIRSIFDGLFSKIFFRKKTVTIGIYGAPNSGKTTLANTICKNLHPNPAEESLGEVSSIAHETRDVRIKNQLVIVRHKKKLLLNLIDTPGIATRIDYERFVKSGIKEKEAKQRAREATKGVIEAIKWLDHVDMVVILVDATKNPYNQINLTIIGNLEARKIPIIIAANKIDLKSAKVSRIQEAFPKYHVIGLSAKFSQNIDALYDMMIKQAK